MAGQRALTRERALREVMKEDVVALVAKQFQPVYERALIRAAEAEERAATARILAHTLQRIALATEAVEAVDLRELARATLTELEIPLDLEVEEGFV